MSGVDATSSRTGKAAGGVSRIPTRSERSRLGNRLLAGFLAGGLTFLLAGSGRGWADENSPVTMAEAEIGIHGNDALWTWTLTRFLSAYADEEVTEGLLADLALDLEMHYRSEGFPFTSVETRSRPRKGKTRVSIYIDEGPRVRVKAVRFVGLSAVAEDELLPLLSARPSTFLSSSYFVRAEVVADARVIRERIQREGYVEVEVEEGVEFVADRSQGIITFRIREGRRIGIQEIRFPGRRAVGRDELLKALSFSPGDSYSLQGVEELKWVIQDTYADRGYVHCQVLPQPAEVDLEAGKAVVTFIIQEGERARVGKIRFAGHRATSDSLLEGQLTFKEGDWFSRKEIRSTLERLYRLGLFKYVRDDVERRGPGEVTVTFRLEERKVGLVRVGIGYGSFEGIRGTVGISYSNLFGRAKRAEAQTRFSRVGSRSSLRYVDPSILQGRWKGAAEIFYEDRDDPVFNIIRSGGTLSFTRPLVEKVTVSLRGRLERSLVSDLATGLVSSDRSLDLRSVTIILTRADRDIPVNPSRGTLLQVALESAGGPLGGEAEFDKLRSSATFYQTLYPDWVILALSGRTGWIFPRNGEEAPIQEQFFTGGEGTLRGFQEKEILPVDSFGIPSGGGGNSLLVLNAELRLRIWQNLWGSLFWDAGNVWEDPDEIDIEDLRHSPGVGLRYVTPIGPIRLDWAHKLYRREDEDPWEIHLSVGFAF